MKTKSKIIIALALIGSASVVAHLYVQSQVYYPVVHLMLPDGLSIAAVLPETKERKTCAAANDRFVTPFKQSCKYCNVPIALCERQLEGLELAIHDSAPVPHPLGIPRELHMPVI